MEEMDLKRDCELSDTEVEICSRDYITEMITLSYQWRIMIIDILCSKTGKIDLKLRKETEISDK